ncbi:polyprotein [Clonorchis sinensis]|uniref:Polyprotein n=1 Tax=Clonorchis sinensis TaxID=79923 RepID=G7Y9Z4_CLOSI|nr:polyprotein [Clonorchis sinensis]
MHDRTVSALRSGPGYRYPKAVKTLYEDGIKTCAKVQLVVPRLFRMRSGCLRHAKRDQYGINHGTASVQYAEAKMYRRLNEHKLYPTTVYRWRNMSRMWVKCSHHPSVMVYKCVHACSHWNAYKKGRLCADNCPHNHPINLYPDLTGDEMRVLRDKLCHLDNPVQELQGIRETLCPFIPMALSVYSDGSLDVLLLTSVRRRGLFASVVVTDCNDVRRSVFYAFIRNDYQECCDIAVEDFVRRMSPVDIVRTVVVGLLSLMKRLIRINNLFACYKRMVHSREVNEFESIHAKHARNHDVTLGNETTNGIESANMYSKRKLTKSSHLLTCVQAKVNGNELAEAKYRRLVSVKLVRRRLEDLLTRLAQVVCQAYVLSSEDVTGAFRAEMLPAASISLVTSGDGISPLVVEACVRMGPEWNTDTGPSSTSEAKLELLIIKCNRVLGADSPHLALFEGVYEIVVNGLTTVLQKILNKNTIPVEQNSMTDTSLKRASEYHADVLAASACRLSGETFSCKTLPVSSSQATQRKLEGWDTAALPERGRRKSRCRDFSVLLLEIFLSISETSEYLLTDIEYAGGIALLGSDPFKMQVALNNLTNSAERFGMRLISLKYKALLQDWVRANTNLMLIDELLDVYLRSIIRAWQEHRISKVEAGLMAPRGNSRTIGGLLTLLRLRWLHEFRMPEEDQPHRALFAQPRAECKQPTGGQCMTWQPSMETLTSKFNWINNCRSPGCGRQSSTHQALTPLTEIAQWHGTTQRRLSASKHPFEDPEARWPHTTLFRSLTPMQPEEITRAENQQHRLPDHQSCTKMSDRLPARGAIVKPYLLIEFSPCCPACFKVRTVNTARSTEWRYFKNVLEVFLAVANGSIDVPSETGRRGDNGEYAKRVEVERRYLILLNRLAACSGHHASADVT